MLFHRLDFFVFFAVVWLAYAVLGHRPQNYLLLAASYVFYGLWDWCFLGLLVLTTLVDFAVGWWLAVSRRKSVLLASIVVNLGVLALFKYANFFVDTFVAFAEMLGLGVSPHVARIIIPVGISFYTFQSMSYTIDVYRGDATACRPTDWGTGRLDAARAIFRSFSDFALYVAFFPQLVAGPIERSPALLQQIQAPRRITGAGVQEGIWLFALGLVMKTGIADALAPQVARVYDAREAGATMIAWYTATVAFALQIYCDFAGYSYMARGAARMLGFGLMENFRQPYLASSFSDFWKRWHISLSTWIRDYLYIPLGGSRAPRWRVSVNLLLTMGLAGLWHGATWAFAAWGLLHGAFLMVEKTGARLLHGVRRLPAIVRGRTARLGYGLLVFHGVLLGWFLFRAGDLEAALRRLSAVGGVGLWRWTRDLPLRPAEALPYVGFLALFLLYEIPSRRTAAELLPRHMAVRHRTCVYAAMLLIFLSAGGQVDEPFIYFQF